MIPPNLKQTTPIVILVGVMWLKGLHKWWLTTRQLRFPWSYLTFTTEEILLCKMKLKWRRHCTLVLGPTSLLSFHKFVNKNIQRPQTNQVLMDVLEHLQQTRTAHRYYVENYHLRKRVCACHTKVIDIYWVKTNLHFNDKSRTFKLHVCCILVFESIFSRPAWVDRLDWSR